VTTEERLALAHANLLLVEIGNSHISIATSVGDRIYSNERFEADAAAQAAAHAEKVWDALDAERLKAIAVASVVPAVLERVLEAFGDRFGVPPLVVGRELRLPIPVAVEDTVGVDRVCAAAAAYEQIREACAVASFGTAITIDCVSADGVFMGGAILPGLDMQARALNAWTAALPRVTIESTGMVYGASTEQAIRNGVLYGVAGALREIVERYATDLTAWPRLVATGGNATLVAEQCDFIDNVVPDLCLRGVALAHRHHFAPPENDA